MALRGLRWPPLEECISSCGILLHFYLDSDVEKEINQQSFPATQSEAYPSLDAHIR